MVRRINPAPCDQASENANWQQISNIINNNLLHPKTATATSDWVAGSPNTVAATDSVTGAAITIVLRTTNGNQPNVRSGSTLEYFALESGTNVSMHDHSDGRIGDVIWRTSAYVKPGWALMNGVANATGSGLDLITATRFIKANSSAALVAEVNTGSTVATASGSSSSESTGISIVSSTVDSHTLYTTGDTGLTTNADGTGNTGASGTGNTGSASTGLTVSNHPTHTHVVTTCCHTVDNDGAGSTITIYHLPGADPSTGTEVSTPQTHTVNESPHTHTGPSHTHTGPSHTHTIADHSHPIPTMTHAGHGHGVTDPQHDHNIGITVDTHLHTPGAPISASLIPYERIS